jgi:mannose-6-phosphate isomerase-like protein (cupin superfamily)
MQSMKSLKLLGAMILILALTAVALRLTAASPQTQPQTQTAPPTHHATTMSTAACATNDCPLLQGYPQTAGLRSGFVRLAPGSTVGWHTTGPNEETLVILHGSGEALIEGAPALPIAEKTIAYIPPATRHNVKNTGAAPLEYVYVVAPAAEK